VGCGALRGCPYLRQVNSTLLIGNVSRNGVLAGFVRMKL